MRTTNATTKTPAPLHGEPVLTLTTTVQKTTIVIDEHPYALTPPDALPLFDRMALETEEGRLGTLMLATERSAADEREMSRLLDTLCRRVLDAPEAVHAKLSETHRLLIFETFLQLPRAIHRPTEAQPQAVASPRRGANSSRGSRASTAAPRTSGAPSSPSVLSGRAS